MSGRNDATPGARALGDPAFDALRRRISAGDLSALVELNAQFAAAVARDRRTEDASDADGRDLVERLRAMSTEGDGDAALRAEAAVEIERLRALLAEDFVEAARLERLGIVRGSPLEAVFTAPVMRVVAAHLAEALRLAEAPNWLELQVAHEELGPLVLTVQRAWGETPGRTAARLAERIRTLEASAAALRSGVRDDAEG